MTGIYFSVPITTTHFSIRITPHSTRSKWGNPSAQELKDSCDVCCRQFNSSSTRHGQRMDAPTYCLDSSCAKGLRCKNSFKCKKMKYKTLVIMAPKVPKPKEVSIAPITIFDVESHQSSIMSGAHSKS